MNCAIPGLEQEMAPQNVNSSESDRFSFKPPHTSHQPARELAERKTAKKALIAADQTRTPNLPAFHQNSTHIVVYFRINLLHIQLPTSSGTQQQADHSGPKSSPAKHHFTGDLTTHQTKLAFPKQSIINA